MTYGAAAKKRNPEHFKERMNFWKEVSEKELAHLKAKANCRACERDEDCQRLTTNRKIISNIREGFPCKDFKKWEEKK